MHAQKPVTDVKKVLEATRESRFDLITPSEWLAELRRLKGLPDRKSGG